MFDAESLPAKEIAKRATGARRRPKALAVLTLIITGRYDRTLYPCYQRKFAEYTPRARFVTLERSRCFAHVEEPAAPMAQRREFLA